MVDVGITKKYYSFSLCGDMGRLGVLSILIYEINKVNKQKDKIFIFKKSNIQDVSFNFP